MEGKLGDFVRTTTPQTKYELQSKERLVQSVKTKMKTIMIGALDEIEKEFGFLWGKNKVGTLTDAEVNFKTRYEILRSKILDKGNNQIRNTDSEFSQYTVQWNRYQLMLKVSNEEGQNESNS